MAKKRYRTKPAEKQAIQDLLTDEAFLRQAQAAQGRGVVFKIASLLRSYGVTTDYQRAVYLAKRFSIKDSAQNYEAKQEGFSVLVFQGLTNIFEVGGGATYDPATGQVYQTDNPLAYAYNNNLPFEVYNLQTQKYHMVSGQDTLNYFDKILSIIWKEVKSLVAAKLITENDLSGMSLLIFFDLVFNFEKKTGATKLKRVIIHTQDTLTEFFGWLESSIGTTLAQPIENTITNATKAIQL